MTRKHFNALAAILFRYDDLPKQLIEDIAAFCASANPSFDHDRFVDAARYGIGLPRETDHE